MAVLYNFEFTSIGKIDDQDFKEHFIAKGYKKSEDNKTVIYFKHNNTYKFIIENNIVQVEVNDSLYKFDKNKKTEAIIVNQGYTIKALLTTNRLKISDNLIVIEYCLDFFTFKGEYHITLKLY